MPVCEREYMSPDYAIGTLARRKPNSRNPNNGRAVAVGDGTGLYAVEAFHATKPAVLRVIDRNEEAMAFAAELGPQGYEDVALWEL